MGYLYPQMSWNGHIRPQALGCYLRSNMTGFLPSGARLVDQHFFKGSTTKRRLQFTRLNAPVILYLPHLMTLRLSSWFGIRARRSITSGFTVVFVRMEVLDPEPTLA